MAGTPWRVQVCHSFIYQQVVVLIAGFRNHPTGIHCLFVFLFFLFCSPRVCFTLANCSHHQGCWARDQRPGDLSLFFFMREFIIRTQFKLKVPSLGRFEISLSGVLKMMVTWTCCSDVFFSGGVEDGLDTIGLWGG